MKIELWPVNKPKPYARNARRISDLAIDKVARSIKEFGWAQPIVVDRDGEVIAGHTRLLAAKKMGEKKVPVYVALDMTPEQVRAYRIADNRSHDEARWDFEMLGAELFDMKSLGLDLAATGFDEDELAGVFGEKTPKMLTQELNLSYKVIVQCENEAHQGQLMQKLESEGLKCSLLIS
jgi:ParB-like chromosome segregation protein Spo0J